MKTPLPKARHGRLLADWVTASLREAVFRGYFEPGEKLDQNLIADELKVSRTPVREAIQRLEAEGFVEIRPHRGAFIAQVSLQDIREVFELRKLLEAEVVRQVTPMIPTSLLNELEDALREAQSQACAGEDFSQQFETDVYFHKSILQFFDNVLFKEVLHSLTNRISSLRRFGLSRPGDHLIQSVREHIAIVQAMQQRDANLAAQLMEEHLTKSSIRIQDLSQRDVV